MKNRKTICLIIILSLVVPIIQSNLNETKGKTDEITAIISNGLKDKITEIKNFDIRDTGSNIEKLGEWDQNYGDFDKISISGNYAAICMYHVGLLILDINDPENIAYYGEYSQSAIEDVVIDGTTAYIAYSTGFEIVDFSDDENIYQVNYYAKSYCDGIDKVGNEIFLSGSVGIDGFLEVIDVTTPASLSMTDSLTITSISYADDVMVEGNYAYLKCGFDGMVIVNVTDTSDLVELANYDPGSMVTGMEIDGNFAYLRNSGIEIVNITDKTNPTFIDNTGYSTVYDFAIDGDELYATIGGSGVAVYDISNRSDPTLLTTISTTVYATFIVFFDTYIGVIQDYYGFTTYDVSTPSSPTFEGHFFGGGYAEELVKDGDLLYIANGEGGLEILNVSDKTNPIRLNYSCTNTANFKTIDYYNDSVILGTNGEGYEPHLVTYNTSELPTIDIESEIFNHAYGEIKIKGDYAFGATIGYGFVVYNITDMSSLVEEARVFTSGTYFTSLDIKEDIAYVGDLLNGLRIINISDVENPSLISTYTITFSGNYNDKYDVVVDDNDRVYITEHDHDLLEIIDVSDPENPVQLTAESYTEPESCYVEGSFLYVALGDNGMEMLDVSNYLNIQSKGTYDLSAGPIAELLVENGTIYAAAGEGGIAILTLDSDSDGLTDYEEVDIYGTDPNDSDSDDDGIDDLEEVTDGSDGYQTDPNAEDSDSDGLTDSEEIDTYSTDPNDADTDDDGLTDDDEVSKYLTDPLVPDAGLDSDGDGLTNVEEVDTYETDPTDEDSDDDSIYDGEEVVEGTDTYITDPNLADTDDDGLADGEEVTLGLDGYLTDPTDEDSDDDGLNDGDEYTAGTDPDDIDTDEDGLSDGEEVNTYETDPLDEDSDDDGLTDSEEVHLYGSNPLVTDSDGDGLSDYDEAKNYHTDPSKADTDDDGLTDYEEINTYLTNPDHPDSDYDGLGDGEEVNTYDTDPLDNDSDDDGILDGEEVNSLGTDPNDADTDDDGLTDSAEILQGLNPLNNDTDGDTLTDGDEVNTYGTNPKDEDSDDDGVNDGVEIEYGTDPWDPDDFPETGGGGLPIVAVLSISFFGLTMLYLHNRKRKEQKLVESFN